MTEAAPPAPEAAPKRRSKGPLVGLLLGVALGAASFGALHAGLVDPAALLGGAPARHGGEARAAAPADLFLPLAPIIVSLAPGEGARHLRFAATIEAAPGALPTVAAAEPRIVDVLNGYLRAVAVAELEDPAAMPRLRAQMLRRVQLVGGGDAARDILITEFILN
ncbi:MAG: flagellar basal body protein FliL [Rhodovulum sulfidophilum]|uniref:Flagellar protein FliL n=1 Tax=Rhodovulum sulfidophilum TaxID=35806 RepID=A0A2W5NDT1_RHOSU|nr:MAG: flagellar basal body protein FliL [Rhodovulum sulfidophilum]